jgi:hypothetical protein
MHTDGTIALSAACLGIALAGDVSDPARKTNLRF